MKPIPFILWCLALLLAAPPHTTLGAPRTAPLSDYVPPAAEPSDAELSDTELSEAELSAAERTEKCFYDFIRRDVIGQKQPFSPDELSYSGFSDANHAYAAIIGFIAPASARRDFDECGKYESDLLTVFYTERNVKGGFARLKVTFKKRGRPNAYTVVFRKKQRDAPSE